MCLYFYEQCEKIKQLHTVVDRNESRALLSPLNHAENIVLAFLNE